MLLSWHPLQFQSVCGFTFLSSHPILSNAVYFILIVLLWSFLFCIFILPVCSQLCSEHWSNDVLTMLMILSLSLCYRFVSWGWGWTFSQLVSSLRSWFSFNDNCNQPRYVSHNRSVFSAEYSHVVILFVNSVGTELRVSVLSALSISSTIQGWFARLLSFKSYHLSRPARFYCPLYNLLVPNIHPLLRFRLTEYAHCI